MHIRTMEPRDLEEVAKVEQVAWGPQAASPETIAARAETFAAGSIVAIQNGRIVGYAASQLRKHISTGTWAEQTDDGTIRRSHAPNGRLAYGVSMSALPGLGGESVAQHVIKHYAELYLASGYASALCVGSRLPGLARWNAAQQCETPLADYVHLESGNRPRDPELRLYAASGFSVLWPLPGYFPDEASLGHGAMMVRSTL